MVKTAITRLEVIGLILVLAVSAFVRLYRIKDYMTFLGDEGRDALVVSDIVKGLHFPLIGPGTSVGNMYLGPLYYYLVAPSLWLFNFSPVGMAVEVALIGILTVTLIWWIGRQWFTRTTALGVSLLYALSPVVIIYSRSSWNPNIMPFFALLTMYGTWKIWQSATWRWLPLIAVSLAFVLNSHYLGLLLFPTVIIFLLLSRNIKKSKNIIFISLVIFFLLMFPLVLFDMRHHWTNFNALRTFFTNRESTVNIKAYKALPNILPIWNDLNGNLLTAGNQVAGQILAGFLALFVLVRLLKKQFDPELIFISAWIGIGLVGLGLYKQHIYVHYYGFLFPAVFLLLGVIFKSLGRHLASGILAIVIFVSLLGLEINGNPFKSSANLQLERTTEIAQQITKEAGGRNFNLALISHTNYDAGYRYIFKLLNSPYAPIAGHPADQLYVICEIPDCKPIGNPLWEVAAFGWAKIDSKWDFPWGVTVYRLIPNPSGV